MPEALIPAAAILRGAPHQHPAVLPPRDLTARLALVAGQLTGLTLVRPFPRGGIR